MIGVAGWMCIWIVAGVTDMRRGFVGLSGMVQTALAENPLSGQVFVFRGERGDLIKVLWWDGNGLCLFAKRLERGKFIWPQSCGYLKALDDAYICSRRSSQKHQAVETRRGGNQREPTSQRC